MGWIESKEKLEADRRDAHRRLTLTASEILAVKEDIKKLQDRLPKLQEQCDRLRQRRDRFDAEWENKYSDDSVNSKKAKLEKLKDQIKKLEREV